MSMRVLVCVAILALSGCSKKQQPDATTVSGPSQPPAPRIAEDPNVKGVIADEPAPSRVRSVRSVPVTIPAGTTLAVRTTSTISTKIARTGQRFAGTLAEPLVVNGRTLAPRGARVSGLVVGATRGGRIKGRARISVRVTAVQITGRGMVPVKTSVVTYTAQGSKKRDALKVGIVSGVGAAIGAIAGGGKGAAIGAGAGAGAGGGYVLATRGTAAVIPSESVMRFQLRAPVSFRKG